MYKWATTKDLFECWAHRECKRKWHFVYGFVQPKTVHVRLQSWVATKYLNLEVKRSVNYDYSRHVEGNNDCVSEDINSSSAKTRFKGVKDLPPKKTGPVRFASSADGKPAFSLLQQFHFLADHMSNMYSAVNSSFRDLLDKSRKDNPDIIPKLRRTIKDISLVPSLVATKRKFASRTPIKGIGNACLGPELFKLAPSEMADIFFPPSCFNQMFWPTSAFNGKVGKLTTLINVLTLLTCHSNATLD